MILADDLGWADLSAYGAPEIRTPNLDALAASGVRFTNGYAASSVCSPTRFGLYTGRYPGRLPGGLQEPIGQPNPSDGIPLDHPTLASLLKGQGYETALIGKWHCGYLPWFSPTRLGLGRVLRQLQRRPRLLLEDQPQRRPRPLRGRGRGRGPPLLHAHHHRARDEFLGRDHDAPWLLNLNFTTPHWPWEGPGDKAVSDELTARIRAGEPGVLFHNDGGSLETYREMVEDLDAAIGKVLAALKRSGQLEDTVVFFASDNGGERFSYYWPFSGGKGDLYEGGIRVSTLLSWPGRLRPRQVSHTPVHQPGLDRDVPRARRRTSPTRASRSTASASSTTCSAASGAPERDLFWRMRGERALRRGDLKYLRASAGEDRLHDLAADEREQANLARRPPDELAALRTAWEAIDATLLPY